MNRCTICNKAFTRKGSLRRHIADVHKDVTGRLLFLGFLGMSWDFFLSWDYPGISLGFWPKKIVLGFCKLSWDFAGIPGILEKFEQNLYD